MVLDKLEWFTYDVRARELGATSERRDAVVLVTVDDETRATSGISPQVEATPWPRALLGRVVDQALKEGATGVVVEVPLIGPSIHNHQNDASPVGDDDALASRLAKHSSNVVLGMESLSRVGVAASRPLTPTIARLGTATDLRNALSTVRVSLISARPTFVVDDGGTIEIWEGLSVDGKAPIGAKERPLTPGDDEAEVDRSWWWNVAAALPSTRLEPLAPLKTKGFSGPYLPLVPTAVRLGVSTIVPDSDGVVRSVPLLLAGPVGYVPSLVLAATLPDAGSPIETENRALVVGSSARIPVDSQGLMTLRWNDEQVGKGGRGTMKRVVSAARLLSNASDEERKDPRHYDNDLRGKIVVLTDLAQTPSYATPVGEMPRAAIIAQGIDNLLAGKAVARIDPRVEFWITMVFAGLGGVLAVAWTSMVRRPGWLVLIGAIAIVCAAYWLIARQLFLHELKWVIVALPILAFTLTFLTSIGYARSIEQAVRDFVVRALGTAVRTDVFRHVEGNLGLMRPDRRALCILTSEIGGLIDAAATKSPATVVKVLQDYLTMATDAVSAHHGHVDSFTGSEFSAFWGSFGLGEEPVDEACAAALAMREVFATRADEWSQKCGLPLVLHIAIDCDAMVVGAMATRHRVNYSVLGSATRAVRDLLRLARERTVGTLVSTRAQARAASRFEFRAMTLGDGTTAAYELVGVSSAKVTNDG